MTQCPAGCLWSRCEELWCFCLAVCALSPCSSPSAVCKLHVDSLCTACAWTAPAADWHCSLRRARTRPHSETPARGGSAHHCVSSLLSAEPRCRKAGRRTPLKWPSGTWAPPQNQRETALWISTVWYSHKSGVLAGGCRGPQTPSPTEQLRMKHQNLLDPCNKYSFHGDHQKVHGLQPAAQKRPQTWGSPEPRRQQASSAERQTEDQEWGHKRWEPTLTDHTETQHWWKKTEQHSLNLRSTGSEVCERRCGEREAGGEAGCHKRPRGGSRARPDVSELCRSERSCRAGSSRRGSPETQRYCRRSLLWRWCRWLLLSPPDPRLRCCQFWWAHLKLEVWCCSHSGPRSGFDLTRNEKRMKWNKKTPTDEVQRSPVAPVTDDQAAPLMKERTEICSTSGLCPCFFNSWKEKKKGKYVQCLEMAW